jgi:hypothetical protein
MTASGSRHFAPVLVLALALVAGWAGHARAQADIRSGELVLLDGSATRFRLVGHAGTYAAPAGISLAALDGKPVRVDLTRDGRVLQITETPIDIEPVTHSRDMITGQMLVGDAVQRTFTLAGDTRVYVAPLGMDIRPYDRRRVQIDLDEHGQVSRIEPLAAVAAAVPQAAACSYAGQSYSAGAAICQAGTQYHCDAGAWRSLGLACTR